MKYSVVFQVMEHSSVRPDSCCQDEPFQVEEPTWIPSVGDSVVMDYGGKRQAFIVLTRHFTYDGTTVTYTVNVVMRPAAREELDPRFNP